MQRTPMRRPQEATGSGSSPKAKRITRRNTAAEPSALPEVSHIQLVQMVHRMQSQAPLDANFIADEYPSSVLHRWCSVHFLCTLEASDMVFLNYRTRSN